MGTYWVIQALANAGVVPNIVCGTSIGAVVGGRYAIGDLARLERWARHLTRPLLGRLFDFQFGHGGLIAGRRLLAALEPRFEGKLIEQLPCRFAYVATDIDRSEGDILPRVEIGTDRRTERRRARWFDRSGEDRDRAADYVKAHGRAVGEFMTRNVITVTEQTELEKIANLLETKRIKRSNACLWFAKARWSASSAGQISYARSHLP